MHEGLPEGWRLSAGIMSDNVQLFVRLRIPNASALIGLVVMLPTAEGRCGLYVVQRVDQSYCGAAAILLRPYRSEGLTLAAFRAEVLRAAQSSEEAREGEEGLIW